MYLEKMGALGQGETWGDDSTALGGEMKISGSNGWWIERSAHSLTGSGSDLEKG